MRAKKPWKPLLVVLLVLGLGVVGCTGSPPPEAPEPQPVQFSEAGDPIPHVPDLEAIGPEGGRVEGEAVVEVSPGVVPDGHEFRVGVGEPLGPIDDVTTEEFGAPVLVEHDADLQAPIRLSWDVSHLTEEQRAGLVLVRWDAEHAVWVVAPTRGTLEGETFAADVSEFSFVTWVSGGAASISQTVGEWSGKRAEAPTCSGDPLPGWVRNVVRPDEDQPAMPIRTCTEPDKNDVLTVRVANNRPYTQALQLTDGDRYAWTWAGDEDFTVAGIVRDTVNKAMSGEKTLVMAPARATAVGLARPAMAGETRLTMDASPTVATVGADVLIAVLGTVFNLDNVGGFDSAALNAFVQSVYDCGGSQLLKSRDAAGSDTFGKVLETVKSCGESDAVRSAIEDVLRGQVAQGGESAQKALKTNRALHSVLGKLGVYLTVTEFASYTAELTSSGAIGDVRVSVYGTGASAALGAWKPTCQDPDADSGMLFKNLAVRDEFRDTSREYWQFPTWESSSRTAVEPLKACSADHIGAVADNVEETWGDKKAAAVVATSIRALAGGGTTQGQGVLNSVLPPHVCWDGTGGWDSDWPIPLTDGVGVAREPDGTFAGVGVMQTEVLGQADMDGDGQQELVLSMWCSGSEPENCCAGQSSLMPTIGVFKAGPVLRQVAPSLMGGASAPGNEYGPAARKIDSATLRGTTIVTTEYHLYAHQYTPEQVGGDPSGSVTVEYRIEGGKWVASRP
ncbi:MAG TPA: hypothetical protein GXZ45_04715 [Propionibacterium sp.]|nr:hypothetical protein [Propionibacterium sp.]